jgi:hypothetical protein
MAKPEKHSREQYLSDFPGGDSPNSLRREALKQALDNRKFEIELYWKRAAYFWAFIAATFTGYFLLQKEPNNISLTYVLACLGLMFSLGWYFVNRGSKAWQQNWESHVDLLEDDIVGPLHKTVVSPRIYSLLNPTDAYPFSVSKINQTLSLFVTIVWVVLIARTIVIAKLSPQGWTLTMYIMTAVTAWGVYMLLRATTFSEDAVEIYLKKRNYVR